MIRDSIRRRVRALMGTDRSAPIVRPPGDDGLFGPHSVAWAVHRDFAAMMIGGIAALQLQMLHPAALAGVWEHSNVHRDPQGRLQRTARFIAVTTYAGTEEALAAIARVRAIHERVEGVLPDGTPYRASDPELLTWVHVAETWSFLRAHLAYRNRWLSGADQDRYFAEMAPVAERLGATGVPTSRREVEAYFARVRPELRSDSRTREMFEALAAMQRAGGRSTRPFGRLTFEAAGDLLPGWAAAMLGLSGARMRKRMVRMGAQSAGTVLRWALRTRTS
jgi:uncharacterized protein (DUF2236 family)